MILSALAFVFGAFCLQQMSVLPVMGWFLAAVPLLWLQLFLAGTSINTFFARIAALRGTRNLAVYRILSRLLRSVRLALHPKLCIYRSALTNNKPKFSEYFRRATLVVSSFLLGFLWAALLAVIRIGDALPAAWENKPLQIIGVVANVSELTKRGERFRFDVEQVLTENAVVPRHISLAYYSNQAQGEPVVRAGVDQGTRFAQFRAGERWRLTVRLKRPHGTQNPHGFDFEAWALAENIRATGSVKTKADNIKLQEFVWRPAYVVAHVRELIQQRIALALAGKAYSGVIQALVMGEDSQIAVNDWQLFLRTGTTHLMSISGLHITMLSGLVFALVQFLWRRSPSLVTRLPARKAATLAGMLTALIYALIAGFAVPTQRTLYMLMVFAISLWSGRRLVIYQVLSLALFVVVLLDPWAVISAGFWLSFGAVAMLSFALGARIGNTHWLIASLQSQWAVTIGMVPLLLIMFNQVSLVSPFANAIAIPVISFIVTPLALLGSFLSLDFVLQLAHLALEICMWALNWLNRLPDAVWQQHAAPAWTLMPAVLGICWMLLPRGVPMRWLGFVGLLPMLLITPLRPNIGDMKATVLDVGQGLSVTVQTARHTLLYDAGGKYSEQADAGSRIILPFLRGEGVARLDGFVVSHDDNDHSGGMSTVLSQMPVSWLASSISKDTLQSLNVKHMPCYAGQRWIWDGVVFEMLYPQPGSYDDLQLSDNNRSCVLKVTSAAGSVLLSGDIERQAELALVAMQTNSAVMNFLKSDVLVAPHHGSKTSSSPEFINAVQPDLTIFTAGYLNRFRHPASEVIGRYEQAGSKILRTDFHGAITLDFAVDQADEWGRVVSWRRQNRRYWHDVY